MRIQSMQRAVWSTALILLGAMPLCVAAQTKSELRERMSQRYPRLQELREKGDVGETYRGYVEAVEDVSSELEELIAAENADRRALYGIIAEDAGTTAEAVGRINAKRILDDADGELYYKTQEGVWVQKKNMKRTE
jgi:uncharacterized protein